jgi:hypothetical protein
MSRRLIGGVMKRRQCIGLIPKMLKESPQTP